MDNVTPEQLDELEKLTKPGIIVTDRERYTLRNAAPALIAMARRALELQGQTALLRGLLADVALSENGLCRFCLEKWSTHDCDVAKALGEA